MVVEVDTFEDSNEGEDEIIEQDFKDVNNDVGKKRVSFENGALKRLGTKAYDSGGIRENRRKTVNSDIPRLVRLTFTNTSRQRAVIYLER